MNHRNIHLALSKRQIRHQKNGIMKYLKLLVQNLYSQSYEFALCFCYLRMRTGCDFQYGGVKSLVINNYLTGENYEKKIL